VLRTILATLALAAAASTALTVPAQASPTPASGHVFSVVENTFEHRLTITGWAFDPANRSAAVTVRLYVDGTYLASVRAGAPSPDLDRAYHLRGGHRFARTVAWTARASTVVTKTRGVRASAPLTTLATKAVTHDYPPAGARIVSVAKRYVGRARYVEGGATPSGFDCSGYTRFTYATARVRRLPHNAEGQRLVMGMRRIARRGARPGDLVFYMSGGSAYHVAIYAGHGMQYAAATPRDGIRYQVVWSSDVEYRTSWH
jgi:cell wall-associated NlpC family hydrolase